MISSRSSPGTLVRLPIGVWVDGVRHCEAALRPLSGVEEEAVGDASLWPTLASRVSALLALVVTRIGSVAPIDLDRIRALAVLDRDVLMLALRQQLFGDRVQTTISCPQCGDKIDLDFHLSDLPIPDRSHDTPRYEFAIDRQTIAYRLPNGGDQEAAAVWIGSDPDRAERTILQRCVDQLDRLSPDQIAALRDEMARRDPQLIDEFDAHCPECGGDFTVHFDIQDFVLREIAGASAQLYRQVHTLAWYYHWSETEILAMPLRKRRIYLDLLTDTIDELTEAHA
jgi:hypothetical protein